MHRKREREAMRETKIERAKGRQGGEDDLKEKKAERRSSKTLRFSTT